MQVKFLIIRFSSIGDIVLTTPVVRCLKEQFDGNAVIHYLTKEAFSPVINANPNIDRIFQIKKHTKEIIDVLLNENYDYIIDLHHNLRSAIVKRQLKRICFTVDKLNFKKWLFVNFKIDKLPDLHIVDRYMETIKWFGIVNDQKGLDYFIPENEAVPISSLPELFRKGYIGFVIGARHNTKMLPVEKIISICKKIGKPIVLLGGKAEMKKAELIRESVGDFLYNGCGKFSINQSASLIQQAEKIITHDTGLMHIAAAFKKEIVSLWGNTVPKFGMYPYLTGYGYKGRGVVAEVKGLSCRPCTKIGFKKCPKGHFRCMKDIDEDQILNNLKN